MSLFCNDDGCGMTGREQLDGFCLFHYRRLVVDPAHRDWVTKASKLADYLMGVSADSVEAKTLIASIKGGRGNIDA